MQLYIQYSRNKHVPCQSDQTKLMHITPKRYFQVHSLRGRIRNVVLPQIDVLHGTNLQEG